MGRDLLRAEAGCKKSTWQKLEVSVPMETKLYQEALNS